jgi:hypothetical protein
MGIESGLLWVATGDDMAIVARMDEDRESRSHKGAAYVRSSRRLIARQSPQTLSGFGCSRVPSQPIHLKCGSTRVSSPKKYESSKGQQRNVYVWLTYVCSNVNEQASNRAM